MKNRSNQGFERGTFFWWRAATPTCLWHISDHCVFFWWIFRTCSAGSSIPAWRRMPRLPKTTWMYLVAGTCDEKTWTKQFVWMCSLGARPQLRMNSLDTKNCIGTQCIALGQTPPSRTVFRYCNQCVLAWFCRADGPWKHYIWQLKLSSSHTFLCI